VFAQQLRERRLPQRDVDRAPWRGIIDDLRDVHREQLPRGRARIGHRRRGEDEHRRGVVVSREPLQPAHDLGDVRAENPSIAVAFVDHDEAQALEEPRPARVAGQERMVGHVGVGEHDVGVAPGPVAFFKRSVAVVRRDPQARQPEVADRPYLVSGQCLGW
jgi:hypothetical protein